MTSKERAVSDAYAVALQATANWRREALSDPDEYERRDRLLRKLELAMLDVTGPLGFPGDD
jgi:hypothetical protein